MKFKLYIAFAAAALLAALSTNGAADEDSAKKPAAPRGNAAEEKIRAALARPCQAEFLDTPLASVVEALSSQYEINVRLDARELESVGIQGDTPITFSIKNVSFKSALGLMLNEFDLTWMIRYETLLITTPEVAEENLLTRVYDVRDLVQSVDPYIDRFGESNTPDFDSLIELITTTVAPDTWDDVGGPGSIEEFYNGKVFAVVVSQTEQVHGEIANLLAELRAVEHQAADEGPTAARIRVGVYPLIDGDGPSPEELAELVREVVGQNQWSKEAGTGVRGVAQSLVVRHDETVQRRVVETLAKLGALDTSLYPLGPYYTDR